MRNPQRGLFVVLQVMLGLAVCAQVAALPRPWAQGGPGRQLDPAEQYRLVGEEALARRDWHNARAAFEKSLELNPKLATALVGLAKVAKNQGKDQEAESYFQEALSAQPDNPAVQLAWGRFLFMLKRLDEAEQVFRNLTRHKRVEVHAYLNLAELYLVGRQEREKAVQAFRAAIDIEPGHAGAHYGLGKTLVGLKRYAEGETVLRRAAELAPRNPLPYSTLGNLYALRGQHDRALAAFGRSIGAAPHYLPAYFMRGEIYFNRRQYDRALKEYLAILKIDSENATAHLRCGFVYERQRRNEAAMRAFRRTIELDPKQSIAYNNLAWISALEGGDLDQALVWSRESLKLSPGTPSFLDTLGWIQHARGHLAEAATALEEAVAASKTPQAEILYHLGVVYHEQGRAEDAAIYLKRALETDENFEHREDARKRLEGVEKGEMTVEVAAEAQS